MAFFSSSTTWAILSWRSFYVCSCQALENPGQIKLAPKFKDFPAPTAIFKDFPGLHFSKIQGLSMTFKVCVTPVLSVFSIFVLCHLVTAPTHNTKKVQTIQINVLRLYLHICPGGGGWFLPSMGYIGESLFTVFASLTYAYHYLMTLIK